MVGRGWKTGTTRGDTETVEGRVKELKLCDSTREINAVLHFSVGNERGPRRQTTKCTVNKAAVSHWSRTRLNCHNEGSIGSLVNALMIKIGLVRKDLGKSS